MNASMHENFRLNGYTVSKASNSSSLFKLRDIVSNEIINQLSTDKNFNKPASDLLDYFHTIPSVMTLTDGEFNSLRRKIINAINANPQVTDLVFEAFQQEIISFLGPDIVVQKLVNLTVQRPHDEYPTEIHRDAPPNSPYELVVWLPLVDCYGSKCMHVTPLDKSLELAEKLLSFNTCSDFENEVLSAKHQLEIPFGSALFFSPILFHFSEKNIESETRFSLNLRFKSMFTPYGSKHPAQFFRPYLHSSISEIGHKFSKIYT